MTPALEKIIKKAKAMRFHEARGSSPQKPMAVSYEHEICLYDKYDGIFLVQKNMIFGAGSIKDSSYRVFEFSKDGDLRAEVELNKLPEDFFAKRDPIYCIQ